MKNLRVIQPFHDKDNYSIVYEAGTVYQFTDERANRLIALGLAEAVRPQRRVKTEQE